MKKLQIVLILLIPLFCHSQIIDPLGKVQIDWRKDQKNLSGDFFVLDSLVSITIPPNSHTLSVNYYDYYLDGNLKVFKLYGFFDGVKKVLKKREYDYDDENRITNFIEYDPNSDTTLIPSEKTTTTWFDDDYFSERIEYSYNGSDWDPVTRKLSPDLGHPDNFTTFNFEWNSIGANWDTVSKTISYLNGVNKVIEMYTYVIIQGEWLIIEMITKEYTNDGDLLLVNEYHTGDNGGSYELERYTAYVYTSEGLLTFRTYIWDLEYGWYYGDVWHWDDYDRLLQYSVCNIHSASS